MIQTAITQGLALVYSYFSLILIFYIYLCLSLSYIFLFLNTCLEKYLFILLSTCTLLYNLVYTLVCAFVYTLIYNSFVHTLLFSITYICILCLFITILSILVYSCVHSLILANTGLSTLVRQYVYVYTYLSAHSIYMYLPFSTHIIYTYLSSHIYLNLPVYTFYRFLFTFVIICILYA